MRQTRLLPSTSRLLNKEAQILALHGFTGCGEDFAKFSPLCGSAHVWTCPNLPGHGPQPSLDCTPEATVQLIDQHAAKLSGKVEATRVSLDPQSDRSVASTHLSSDKSTAATAPRILLGYSMGARAALLHAVAHPAQWDALILISANPGIEDESERASRAASDQALAQRITASGVPAFLDDWQQTPMIRSQQHIRADWQAPMQHNRLQQSAEGLAASLEQFGQAACPNLWPQLNRLPCPALLISGEQDSKYCAIAQRMQRSVPQAQWASIAQVGHMPHLEAPEATATEIQSFIALL